MSIGNATCHAILLTFWIAPLASGQDFLSFDPVSSGITHHELSVELVPATHELMAQDLVHVAVPASATRIAFSLAPTLQVESLGLLSESAKNKQSEPLAVTFTVEQPTPSLRRIVVTLPSEHATHLTLLWTYRGLINDPPKEPRHLRFVTPSETAGHIGLEGVYLSSESQWYPDIEGSLSSFHVITKVPQDWTVVTQGKKAGEIAQDGMKLFTWAAQDRSEALTLVANRFVAKSRKWTAVNGQSIELATYFLPENAALADEYLDATAKYLDAYIPVLGDYPFEKFAVVENFFASGLGMPSFTLLGSGSIKRHYVQPYALGHEIVHSWIGNSVLNRAAQGNWVEGLTTYLANYYWHELAHDERQAREQRRLMVDAYSLYVTPEEDYPVAQFVRKNDEKDNAIGYQKAAFAFHMLRREIGEKAFWRGLKTFVRTFQNRPADWASLEHVFARASGQDLRWFFAQWIEQAGAPQVTVREATARRVSRDPGSEIWHLRIRVRQGREPFRVTIPIEITMKEASETQWLPISRTEEETIEIEVRSRPLQVRLDPDLMVFRRMQRDQLPPMLNEFVTDSTRTVVQGFSDPASPLRQVVTRMIDQDSALPEARRTMVTSDPGRIPATGSVLLLVGAGQHKAAQPFITESCKDRVKLEEAGFQVDGQAYEGPTLAVLLSCHRANVPGSVITVLYGVTPEAVSKVARLLFYYGWHSYVVFSEGVVAKRELWEPVSDIKEVQLDGNR